MAFVPRPDSVPISGGPLPLDPPALNDIARIQMKWIKPHRTEEMAEGLSSPLISELADLKTEPTAG